MRERLDALYERYNRREYVHPDPVEFLYRYEDVRDREVVGLIASSLAYGRVKQILKSVSNVLERMKHPAHFLDVSTPRSIGKEFTGFKHRFTTDDELVALLVRIKLIREEYGTLESCYCVGSRKERLAEFLKALSGGKRSSLVPKSEGMSANKRMHLFLRWMVRRDEVDPGGWRGVSKSELNVPLDTHSHRITLMLGLTKRKQADIRTVQEITEGFRRICPHDPVKYDFALTRFGIREEMNYEQLKELMS
jgi:uncharacterized protein (TIGR02757 family)